MSKILNGLSDFQDGISSPSTRAGRAVQRVGNMTRAGVVDTAQAAQMSHNSPTGETYTVQDIQSYQKLAQDSQTRVVVTQSQANALIKDALQNQGGIGGVAVPS